MQKRGFDSWVRKISWSRKWQPTPVFLPGQSCGQRSLVGSSWGSHTVRHDCEYMHLDGGFPSHQVLPTVFKQFFLLFIFFFPKFTISSKKTHCLEMSSVPSFTSSIFHKTVGHNATKFSATIKLRSSFLHFPITRSLPPTLSQAESLTFVFLLTVCIRQSRNFLSYSSKFF